MFQLTNPIGDYLWLIALVAGIWMILLVSRHLHHFFSFITTLRELVRQIAWVSVIGSFLLMGILFVLKVKVNRSLVLAYIVYLTAFLIVFKAFFRSYLIYLSQTGRVCRNVLIVGAGRVAARVIRGFAREPALGRRIVGCVVWGDQVSRTHFMGVPVIGSVGELSDILHRLPVDEVIQAVPPTSQTPYQPVLRCCQEMGIPCRILSGLSAPQHAAVADDLWGHVFIVYQSGRKPLRQMVFKHALDFCGLAAGRDRGRAAHRRDRAARPGHLQRAGLLYPGAPRLERPEVPHVQVPDHGGRRRGAAGAAGPPERDVVAGVQDRGRPPDHAGGAVFAQDEPGRAAATVQRPAGRDELRWGRGRLPSPNRWGYRARCAGACR